MYIYNYIYKGMYRKLRRNIIAGKTEKKGPNMIDENILHIFNLLFLKYY